MMIIKRNYFGRNGIGAKACNIFSTNFQVEIGDAQPLKNLNNHGLKIFSIAGIQKFIQGKIVIFLLNFLKMKFVKI